MTKLHILKINVYLSVSSGTIRTRSFGLNVRALLMNWLAKDARTPNGGFRPMICSLHFNIKRIFKNHVVDILNDWTQGFLKLTSFDPSGNSPKPTVIQSLFSKLKSFCKWIEIMGKMQDGKGTIYSQQLRLDKIIMKYDRKVGWMKKEQWWP